MSSPNASAPNVSAGITVNLLELVEAFPNYEDPDRVRNDVLKLSTHCKTLVPKRGTVATLGSGLVEILTLHGTFPMVFRQVTYHTPVQMYITNNYPASPPLCYIIPTPGMSLRVGHHSVDQSGLVSLPYLREWSGASHNLAGLVDGLSAVFGAEPPLFATPAGTAPTKTLQASGTSAKRGTVQVVCPSYGRTGTKSMQAALQILGFGPCYHMENVLSLHMKDHPKLWLDGFQGRGLAVDKILDGYVSVADWPVAHFYKEILAANPDAKVVVTQRDPDAWWKSMSSTLHRGSPCWGGWGLFFLEVLFADVRLVHHMILHIKTCSMGEEEAKADYARHNEDVLAHVNPDKLLEFSVKQGWEPLCEFLEVPVPDVPFPKTNSAEGINAFHQSVNVKGWVLMATTITAAGASVAAASFFGGKRAGGALAATEGVVLASRFRKAFAMRRIGPGKRV